MLKRKISLILNLFSGFHDPHLDAQFQAAFGYAVDEFVRDWPCDLSVRCFQMGDSSWMQDAQSQDASVFLGFSAGVIPAAIAAHWAKLRGQNVLGLIAMDGWGVPLPNSLIPTCRFSHDLFTHTTSSLLGGPGVFFADPPVPHLPLWAKPEQVRGWYLPPACTDAIETTAMEALIQTIQWLAFPRLT